MPNSLWHHGLQHARSLYPSWSLLKLIVDLWVMLSNCLIFWCQFLLLPSIIHNIRVFFNELALRIRWPMYWSFSFSISPSNEYSGLISFMIDWLNLLTTRRCSFTSKGLLRVFSSITIRKHHISGIQPSLWYKFHICTWLLKKTIALTTRTFDGKMVALFFFVCLFVFCFNMMS